MNITAVIDKLSKLKEKYGDVEVIVYQYNGCNEEPCVAVPKYSKDDRAVIIDAKFN
jgi:hypothetical protein